MSLYNDIDINFNLDATGDLVMVSDIDAINQGLRILVETITGFRPGAGNEFFGLNLRQYLFSELSYVVAERIGNEINTQVAKYEPRVTVENVNVEIYEEEKAYLIDLFYKMKNTGKSGSFRMVVSVK